MEDRMKKIKMVMSIDGEFGSTTILETTPVRVEDILFEGHGGTRTYFDIPDLSIYNKEKRISVDLYKVEESEE